MFRTFGIAAIALMGTAQVQAQTATAGASSATGNLHNFELSAFLGYSFNDDVNFDANQGLARSDVNFYDSIGPKNRLSYGAKVGYDLSPSLQVGVLWSRYSSPLELNGFDAPAALAAGWSGPATTGGTSGTSAGASFPVLTTTNGLSPFRIGDMAVNNFHAVLQWTFFRPESSLRPFVFGGLGLTHYGSVDYQFVDTTGQTTGLLTQQVAGNTRFSTTWGVGVRFAATDRLGLRVTGRWTPTRLPAGNFTRTTTASGDTLTGGTNSGWSCDAYWGCFTNKAQTVSQWAVTAGVSYRF